MQFRKHSIISRKKFTIPQQRTSSSSSWWDSLDLLEVFIFQLKSPTGWNDFDLGVRCTVESTSVSGSTVLRGDSGLHSLAPNYLRDGFRHKRTKSKHAVEDELGQFWTTVSLPPGSAIVWTMIMSEHLEMSCLWFGK